ncbi:MAG: hypothetical protein ACKVS7_14585 [Gemmatimonadaceae bacterium]
MTESAMQAPRIAQEFELAAQQELLAILHAVEEFRDLIAPEEWPRAAATARAVAARIAVTTHPRLACNLEEWTELARLVEAAWRHTNRPEGLVALAGLRQIGGVTDVGFGELLRRCTASLHTPLPPTVVHVDDARRRAIAEALAYVKQIHHEINPEMFRVGRDELDSCTALLARAAQAHDVVLLPDELSHVEMIIAAAWTYSYRAQGTGLTHVKEPEFDALMRWLGTSHRAMLRAAGLPTIERLSGPVTRAS